MIQKDTNSMRKAGSPPFFGRTAGFFGISGMLRVRNVETRASDLAKVR